MSQFKEFLSTWAILALGIVGVLIGIVLIAALVVGAITLIVEHPLWGLPIGIIVVSGILAAGVMWNDTL